MSINKLKFEILVIDKNDKVQFNSVDRFKQLIASNERLCTLDLVDDNSTNSSKIKFTDRKHECQWSIQKLDTSQVLGDFYSSAYIVTVEGAEEIISFVRQPLITQLSNTGFKHIRLLTDEYSQEIGHKIYPLINEIENLLRRYVVKFFTIKIGVDYSQQEQIISSKAKEKIKIRRDNDKTFVKDRMMIDIEYVDFDELGEIIYQQKTAFHRTEDLVKKVESSNDINELKKDIQGNYSKYFKDYFEQKDFENKWKKCFEIRNKVAHNYIFETKDFDDANKLVEELKEIILRADEKINEAVFSIAEKQALISQPLLPRDNNLRTDEIEKSVSSLSQDTDKKSDVPSQKIIKEEEVIEELEKAEKTFVGQDAFVGLKHFVNKTLADKGFEVHSSYVVINILADKDIVEIYDHDNIYGDYPVKAIRLLSSHAK